MNIAFIAHDKKKELLSEFCIAYKAILQRHSLYATGTTGSIILEATGLDVYLLSPGMLGGVEQISARVSCKEIDLVIFFNDPHVAEGYEPDVRSLLKICDEYYIPFATNLATAEIIIKGIDHEDNEWRNIQSFYNK